MGLETGEERQNFYWDFGVAAMEDKDRKLRYYLQDELGSPLRVLYGNGNGDIYGYDEFGGELYEAPDPEKEASNRYSRQGEGQPFGYTGYRYDAVGGTYFAQAREYKAEFGRFLSKDLFKGYIILTKTFNRYLYCINNPLLFVDRDGNILESVQNLANESLNDLTNNTVNLFISGYDDKGKELLNKYIYGDGSELTYKNDSSWNNYMIENDALTIRTGNYLAPIGENLKLNETKNIYMEVPMIIQGDKKTGYMLIHGSNEDYGNYQIKGTISKDANGVIVYDMNYTFNDYMDPNFDYKEDINNYNGLKFLQGIGNDITMKEYILRISWSDKTIINPNGEKFGWLSDMKNINVEDQITNLSQNLNLGMYDFWWERNTKLTAKETLEWFQMMQNAMNTYQDYYGCSD